MAQRIFMLFTQLPGLMRLGVLILAIGGDNRLRNQQQT